jgi:BlaI family penicillinase repressor
MVRPKQNGLSEKEMEVMKILWKDSPLKVAEILERLSRSPKPAYTSLMTLVQSMTKKGYLNAKQEGKAYCYSPLLKEKSLLSQELKKLASNFFDGTTKDLVMNLVRNEKLSPDEVAELQDILGSKK